MSMTDDILVGFEPDEVRIGEPTRSARLKWVIVVDEALPAGRAVNAAVCVSAGTATRVAGLLSHHFRPSATRLGTLRRAQAARGDLCGAAWRQVRSRLTSLVTTPPVCADGD